jgi:hypothetical protein
MNSGLGNGGVLVNSGLLNGGIGSGSASGGAGGTVIEQGVQFFLGPNGSSRRNWRMSISPLSEDTNAFLIENKNANGIWQTSTVFLAKPVGG